MALPPDSINALMIALKRREGSSGLNGMGDAPAAPDVASKAAGMGPNDMTGEDDDSGVPDQGADPDVDHEPDADTAKHNAEIVGILQSSYPKIFAKISAQVEDDPEPQTGPPDGDDMPQPGATAMQP